MKQVWHVSVTFRVVAATPEEMALKLAEILRDVRQPVVSTGTYESVETQPEDV